MNGRKFALYNRCSELRINVMTRSRTESDKYFAPNLTLALNCGFVPSCLKNSLRFTQRLQRPMAKRIANCIIGPLIKSGNISSN